MTAKIKARLEYLRGELRAERISYGELSELQSLARHITPDDVELLEAAGVPEQAVELIASGYEWVCPKCDHLNHEIETKSVVLCADCDETFRAETAEHAYGR